MVVQTLLIVPLYVHCLSEMIRVHFCVTDKLSALMCAMDTEGISKSAVSKVYRKIGDGRRETFNCLSLCFQMSK